MILGKKSYTWYQPASNIAITKARNLDGIMGLPEGIAEASAIVAAGLECWVQSSAQVLDYQNYSGILIDPDEPNGSGNKSPAEISDITQQIRSRLRGLKPKPLALDLDGAAERFQDDSLIQAYASCLQPGDILQFDYYPISRGDGPEAIPQLTTLAQRMRRLAPAGVLLMAWIECSDQELGLSPWGQTKLDDGSKLADKMRPPTLAEFQAELEALKSCDLYGFFPDDIGAGWKGFDSTVPAINVWMQHQNLQPTTPASPLARTAHTVVIDGVNYVASN